MLNTYYNETKYIVESFSFQYRDGYYKGRGTLTWEPETGFHIEGFMERHGAPVPKKYGIGEVGVIPEADFRTIRMRLRNNGIAIAPHIPLTQKHDLFTEKYLDESVSRMIFINRMVKPIPASNWWGSGLYKVSKQLGLPDSVEREEKINDEVIGRGFSRAGILYEEKGLQKIIGHLDESQNLILNWRLDKTKWTKEQSWAWPDAAGRALSILSGERVKLLKKEFFKEQQRVTKICRQADIEGLGLLSLFDDDHIDKQIFMNLTEFFVRNPEQARICSNLYNQVFDASHQKSWQAMELLLSTALEAVLRSIDGKPFTTKKSKSREWEIKRSLEDFRKNYLSDEWKPFTSKALLAHLRLRDRNAHPDWIISTGGALSDAEKEKSLDDMIFLSRFYGYIILSLSGRKNMKPVFPRPHREWRPVLTVEEIE